MSGHATAGGRTRSAPALFSALIAVMLAGCGSATPVFKGVAWAPGRQSTIVHWLQNAEPAGWDARSGRIVLNRRGSDRLWDAYTIAPDGRAPRCLTCRQPSFPGVGAATNRGASDVSPDGRFVLLVVEKGSHPGARGAAETEPGRGVYNDLWLMSADGAHVWRLTDIPVSSDQGVIWPRFDRTGSQIVWAQMDAGADLSHPLGQWTMKVARVRWSNGAPYLDAARTYDRQPGRFFEPYAFSPDNRRILFASDVTVSSGFLSPSAFNAQIWTIDAARVDDLRRVSPPDHLHGPFSDYNEFAYYIPETNRILFARTMNSSAHGMDYWTVNSDGSDPRRLTFMNQPHTEQFSGYSVGGGIAFDPTDPRRFVAGVSHDLGTKHVQAVFVTIR
ncbi:MAG TPA: hypothetical protein VMU39_22795 [Solirubrobacteraceae bacterium]|nr:hypothetical protein [Solirubrobacteraceae bacterium]